MHELPCHPLVDLDVVPSPSLYELLCSPSSSFPLAPSHVSLQLIEMLGGREKVAELTGRKGSVSKAGEGAFYERRSAAEGVGGLWGAPGRA